MSTAVAQQPNLRKELKSVFEVLPEEAKMEVIGFAGTLIQEGSEVLILSEKTLFRNLRYLSPEDLESLLDFAERQARNEALGADPLLHEDSPDSLPPAVSAEQVMPFDDPVFVERPLPASVKEAQDLPATEVKWLEDTFDFAQVEQGTKVTHIFRFKNTGVHPLRLTQAEGSCGCTVIHWNREAVPPGEEGAIHVEFDTKGRLGPQHKTVAITLNARPIFKVLLIRGEILVSRGPQE